MNRWFFFLALCLCSLGFASPIQDHRIEPASLAELALVLDIPEDADLIVETQKRWLRRPGQERWELSEISPEKRLFVLDWAKENGLFSPWTPNLGSYDKALILGATTSRMELRLNFLKQLWVQGTRFSEIVWLTGDRPLDARVDGLTDRCKNESEAARILFEETDLPEDMRSIPVVFVAVPMKMEGGSLKRPNTEDTLIAWQKIAPQSCTALFVSDQPFCGYQFAVINSRLPESIQFDVVGQGVDSPNHPAAAAIILDSVARWIYQNSK